MLTPDFLALPLDWLRAATPFQVKQYYWAAFAVYSNPWFWGFTLSILLLERLRPAVPAQGALSRGFWDDFIWFNADVAWKVALLPGLIGVLRWVYDGATGGAHFTFMNSWPLAGAIVVSVLIFDFLQWFHHWVRHKVTAFWHFHAIHHSQRELNVFTDLRVHMGESVISEVLVFVPLFALNLPVYAIMGVGALRWWYTRFIHANIRTNLGWGRYFLVTPQSHRVHHSIEPEHRDKNFGVVLSIWDRMFGTLVSDYEVYPATGLAELAFPPPAGASPLAWAANFFRMLAYPFVRIGRDLAGRFGGKA